MGKYKISYTLEKSIIQVLIDNYTAQIKPIIYGSCIIEAKDFKTIAYLVKLGKIDVYRINTDDPEGKLLPSAYVSKKNRFEFRFKKANTTEQTALVIHEAAHAIMDMKKHSLMIKESEAIAYILQCQYAMMANPYGGPLVGESGGTLKFEKAWSAAETLRSQGSLSVQAIKQVGEAIAKDPWYLKDSCVKANFNGI